MSIEERKEIESSKNIIFRSILQKNDILSLDGVRTELIAFLRYLVNQGLFFEVTALKSDHHDDLDLSLEPPHCGTHAGGWAIDCWPLSSPKEGAYLDAGDDRFQHFLRVAQNGPYFLQIGLAGTADTALNRWSAGPSCFEDTGYDHVHLGVQED